MSPQVKASLYRAAILFVIAVIPVLITFATEVLDPTTGILVAGVLLALGRTAEGYYDQGRADGGDVRPADVGAYWLPIGDKPDTRVIVRGGK